MLRAQEMAQTKQVEKRWVTLEDSHLIEFMLKSVGEDKKNIIFQQIVLTS